MKCEWVQDNLALYVYDEIADDVRYELEQHLARCPECERELAGMLVFREQMTALPLEEPEANLVATSRLRLSEALESTTPANWLRRWTFDLSHWMPHVKLQPALVAAIFIVGFSVGGGVVYQVTSTKAIPVDYRQTAADIGTASVAGIRSVTPDPGTNQVTIQYDTVHTEQAQGSLNDARIQRLLLYAAHNNYNVGVRQDSVGLLAQQPSSEQVRVSLLYSLRNDANPGVRLTALDGLGGFVKQDQRVRDGVLEALLNDSNAGVRIKAMELLQPVSADSTVRVAMEHLARKDKNESIRSQARRVLAQIPEID